MSKYAYLGPVGTFTEAALKKITTHKDDLVPYANVTAVLDAVRSGEAEAGLVPIENSVEGVVARTLDELATGEHLEIIAETHLPVTFALMTLPGKTELNTIATHPHAESQCRTFVARKYPHADVITTASTAAAAEAVRKGEYDAAIAAPIAAAHYGLEIIADNIGDNTTAVTRFVLVRKPTTTPAPTGYDRTSLVLYIDGARAGALLEILQVFAENNVNMTFIQSRPTGRELGHYHFIIDVEGHMTDEAIATSLTQLRKICDEVRFLGSYPRERLNA